MNGEPPSKRAVAFVDGQNLFHGARNPGLYGPLDVAVYDELVGMAAAGDALIDETGRYPRYVLTGAGRAKGEAMLRPCTRLPPTTSGVRRGGFS